MKLFSSVSSSKKKEKSSPAARIPRQEHTDYWDLMNRLNKTMYYGTEPKTERPSLALTDVAVSKFTMHDHLYPSLENLHMEKASGLSREACISPCSLVLAMVYIDRLGRTNPNFLATVPSSKLFIVSVMVASKFLHDEGEDDEVFNDEWANSVDMELTELNQLEREFLQAIDWRLLVDQDEFNETLHQIEKQIALKESAKRGWFSYTDLDILSENSVLNATLDLLASHVLTVTLACSAAYIASLLTLLGSAAIVSRLPWNQCSTDVGTLTQPDFSSDLPVYPQSSEMIGNSSFALDLDGILNDEGLGLGNVTLFNHHWAFPAKVVLHRHLGSDFPYGTLNLPYYEPSPLQLHDNIDDKFCRSLKIPSCGVTA